MNHFWKFRSARPENLRRQLRRPLPVPASLSSSSSCSQDLLPSLSTPQEQQRRWRNGFPENRRIWSSFLQRAAVIHTLCHGDLMKNSFRFGGTFSIESFSSSSSSSGVKDYGKEVDEINLKFAEAREEIEMAMESKETVYFNEEADCARAAVKIVIDMFDGLCTRLPEEERRALQRSMGLKIEQIKAELQQLNE